MTKQVQMKIIKNLKNTIDSHVNVCYNDRKADVCTSDATTYQTSATTFFRYFIEGGAACGTDY